VSFDHLQLAASSAESHDVAIQQHRTHHMPLDVLERKLARHVAGVGVAAPVLPPLPQLEV